MNLILASTSKIYGLPYLSYLETPLRTHFAEAEEILFIPYARPGGITHDQYTETAREGLQFLGKNIIGLHQTAAPQKALRSARAIFTGGGNTFLLVQQLYQLQLMDVLREVLQSETPYLGTSAGSNICGQSMRTTNDMPIVYPPSFDTLGLVPFNLNVHYLDPDPNSKHQGETRETRIKEFQNLNDIAVVGLREGSWLQVKEKDILLKGPLKARIFEPGKPAYEIDPNSSLKKLGL